MRHFYTLVALLLLHGTVPAQSSIEYHPNGVVRMGYGYEPRTPTVPFVTSCISHEGEEKIDASGGIAVGSVEVTEVSDRRSLLSTVGVSASMEAHSAMFSGGVSFSQNIGVSFDESTLVWVARIKVNFGRYRLKNPLPMPRLTGAANPAEAKARCGSEIVTQESRGALAAVVYEAHNLSNAEKQELSAALNAKYSGPTAGAEFDSAYTKAAKKVQSKTRINTYVHVQGGAGSAALTRFVDATDLAAVRAALTAYGNAITTANAAPLTYQTSPLSQFVELPLQAPPNLAQDRLWEIYSQYENLTGLIRRIDFLVKATAEAESYLIRYVDSEKRKELGDVRILYEQGRDLLKTAAIACLVGGAACNIPGAIGQLPRVKWPPIPPGPTLVGVSRCIEPYIVAVGAPPPKAGEKMGTVNFRLGLVGDMDLFDSVWLVATDSRVPMKASLVYREPKNAKNAAGPTPEKLMKEQDELLTMLAAVMEDPIQELFKPYNKVTVLYECSTRTNVDRDKLFGAVIFTMDLLNQTSLGTLEVVDRLGRRSVYELDKFN